jgi:hypothetical protein
MAVFIFSLILAALPAAFAQSNANSIVPSKNVGKVHLGRYGAAYLSKLPRPDANDSGMGRYRSVWVSKRPDGHIDTLYIYSVANGPRQIEPLEGVSIELIRVTSPWYRTRGGLSTGSTLAQILRGFPDLRPTDDSKTLYDDAKDGIAFEFAEPATADSLVTAIIIHQPGKVDLATAQDVNKVLRSGDIQQ